MGNNNIFFINQKIFFYIFDIFNKEVYIFGFC